jgi:hypothetical protein
MAYLSIPFSFSGCNLRHNETITGMPAMSAIAGMAHNAERIFREMGFKSLRVEAFSWVLFSLDRDEHAPRRPAQEVRKGQAILPALMDIRRGHGEAALVLSIHTAQSSDYDELCRLMLDEPQRLNSYLENDLTMAGAAIFLGLSGEFQSTSIGVALHETFANVVKSYLRAYPTKGLLMQDMSRYLSEYALDTQQAPLDALLDCLYASQRQRSGVNRVELDTKEEPLQIEKPTEDTNPNDDFWADFFSLDLNDLAEVAINSEPQECEEDVSLLEEYQGILLPTAVGYHEICPPQGQRHFVETVMSLIRARVLASVLKELKESPQSWEHHFWVWEHLPHYRLFRTLSLFNHCENHHG